MKNRFLFALLALSISAEMSAQQAKKKADEPSKPFGTEVKPSKIQPAFGRIGLEYGIAAPQNGNQTIGQARGARAEIGFTNFLSLALSADAQTGRDSLLSGFQTSAGLQVMPFSFGRLQPFVGAGAGFGFGQSNGGGRGGPGGPGGLNAGETKKSWYGRAGFNFVLAPRWILAIEENFNKQFGANAATYGSFLTRLAVSYQFGEKRK